MPSSTLAPPTLHPGEPGPAGLRWLCEANWLDAQRARAWCVILALVSFGGMGAWVASAHQGVDRMGRPLGTDFVSFWTAARLTLAQGAGAAYEPALHAAAQHQAFPDMPADVWYAFFYPPSFLLLCLPLAALPYFAALATWLATTFAALFTALRRLLPQRWAVLPIVASPAMLVNATHGQNAFLSAACFGWGILLMGTRPWLAGTAFGLLAFKPHLAVALPIALLAARRWRVIAGAACSSVGLSLLSWAVLGTAAWAGFDRVSPLARQTLEQGLVEPWKMQSLFAAIRLLHGGLLLAYAAQGLLALVVLALLARLAYRRPGTSAEGAAIAAASALCTPFLLDYDLVMLSLPLAWVAARAQQDGWRNWEKIVCLAAYVLPLIARPLAGNLDVSVAPVIMALLFLIVYRRALSCR